MACDSRGCNAEQVRRVMLATNSGRYNVELCDKCRAHFKKQQRYAPKHFNALVEAYFTHKLVADNRGRGRTKHLSAAQRQAMQESAAARAAVCQDMRKRGMTYKAIADQLRMSLTTVHFYCNGYKGGERIATRYPNGVIDQHVNARYIEHSTETEA